jgi:hypothetical protein
MAGTATFLRFLQCAQVVPFHFLVYSHSFFPQALFICSSTSCVVGQLTFESLLTGSLQITISANLSRSYQRPKHAFYTRISPRCHPLHSPGPCSKTPRWRWRWTFEQWHWYSQHLHHGNLCCSDCYIRHWCSLLRGRPCPDSLLSCRYCCFFDLWLDRHIPHSTFWHHRRNQHK